jgi:hypothetical protein
MAHRIQFAHFRQQRSLPATQRFGNTGHTGDGARPLPASAAARTRVLEYQFFA